MRTPPHRLPPALRYLLLLRLLLATGVLGAVMLAEATYSTWPAAGSVRLLIGVTYALTAVYYAVWRLVGDRRLLHHAQFIADLAIISGIVLFTDGLQSPFTFLYILPIIGASMYLPRRSSLTLAALAGVGYLGAALDVSVFWRLPLGSGFSISAAGLPTDRSYLLFFHLSAFFLVAFLGSNLAEKVTRRDRELRATSDSLEELQHLHARVVNGMSIGLFTTDRRGRITSFNQAAQALLGYTWPQVRGQSCAALFPAFPLKGFLDVDQRRPVLARLVEAEFGHRDGQTIHLTMSLSPLAGGDGDSGGMVGIFQDSTQLHEMRLRLQRADRLSAVGRFAAGIAHEIRNPLASLSGSLQVLRNEAKLDATNGRLLDIALREADRLNSTITEFLTYARPQAPELHAFDLNVLVKETLELLTNSPQHRQEIALQVSYAPQPALARVDVHQMRQVIWNLCLNALQAMPEGGTLQVRTSLGELPLPAGNGTPARQPVVVLSIEDSGAGIPPDLQQQIFEPFYSTKSYGSGLGLAAVHQIIEAHHGDIQLDSEPGRGSTFAVLLPAVSEPPQAAP